MLLPSVIEQFSTRQAGCVLGEIAPDEVLASSNRDLFGDGLNTEEIFGFQELIDLGLYHFREFIDHLKR